MSVLFRGQVKSGGEGARDRPGRECSHIFFGRLPMVLPRGGGFVLCAEDSIAM